VAAVAQDDALAEQELRLRALPFDELLDGVPVSSLSIIYLAGVAASAVQLSSIAVDGLPAPVAPGTSS
jgi:hypothetical protein